MVAVVVHVWGYRGGSPTAVHRHGDPALCGSRPL